MSLTVTVSLSLPESIISKVDSERSDVSRSRYIARLLEKAFSEQDGIEKQ
jgi:metal-responsive CopG/Arc/MetJ family transcriptional regulator